MQRKVKVLLFVPNLQQGGAERQILELYRHLPRERFEPTLCVWEDVVHYRSYLPPGEPKHVLGHKVMGIRGLRAFIRVLREEKPDIVHSYRDKANFWARLARRWAPVPVLLTSCRNQDMALHHRLLEPFMQRISDKVLTNSEGVRHELVTKAHVPAERVQVIHNFIDTSRFHPAPPEARRAARAVYGIADDELAFLLPGRISRQKNQIGLLRALRILVDEGRMPANLRVLLAGRDRDPHVSAIVPKLIKRHKLDAYVRRLGTIDENDMTALYGAADAVLLPSIYEGLPNAIIECSTCAIPAIVTAGANADKLVIDGETGFEVPTKDARKLADAIVRMAALSHEERRKLGAAAARAIRRLDPQRVLGEILDLYDDCLHRKAPELLAQVACAG